MTTTRGKSAVASAVLVAIAYIVGCGGGEFYQLGQKAEKKGDPASAYNHYARAAAQDRSGAVRESLARTRPAATAQAERAGLDALDEDRYDDAWRAFMRTLEIQPDHPTAVQLVRQLENEHPREIAGVKRDWLTRGSGALSVPEVRVLAMAPPPSLAPRVRLALPPISLDETNSRPTIPLRETTNPSAWEKTSSPATPERQTNTPPVTPARETTALAALPLREGTVPPPPTVTEPAATPKIPVQKATAPPVRAAPPAEPVREANTPPATPARESSAQPATTIQDASTPSAMPVRKATVPPVRPTRETTVLATMPLPPAVVPPTITVKEPAASPTIPETKAAAPPAKPVREVSTPLATPAQETSVSPKSVQETTTPSAMPVRKATVSPEKPAQEITHSPDKPVGQVILVRASDPVDSKPARHKKSRPRPQPAEVDDLEPVVLPPEPAAPPPRPVPPTSIHTLSLNDRRYSRMTLAVDGIGVRVKNTESGGVADLDLFDGKKRIQKIRDLEVGRSQTFVGKSGTLYRVTLLGVHHKSRTVRLGVKRA